MKKRWVFIAIMVISGAVIWLFCQDPLEKKRQAGLMVIEKVEAFRLEKGRLPTTLKPDSVGQLNYNHT